jgi:hypothetical protein
MIGHMTKLGMGCSALVYYVDEPDGFHLVVTTQRGVTDRAAVERFETVFGGGTVGSDFDPPRRGRGGPGRD